MCLWKKSYKEDEVSLDHADVDAYIPLETLEELQRLPESLNLRSIPPGGVSIPVEGEPFRSCDNSEGKITHSVEDPGQEKIGGNLRREGLVNETTREVERPNTPVVERNNLPFPEEHDGEKSPNGLEPSREIRSKRKIKPVVKLRYDELGKATNRPIYTITHGMPMHCCLVSEGMRSYCNTVWCHPLATCRKCSKEPEKKIIKHL